MNTDKHLRVFMRQSVAVVPISLCSSLAVNEEGTTLRGDSYKGQ